MKICNEIQLIKKRLLFTRALIFNTMSIKLQNYCIILEYIRFLEKDKQKPVATRYGESARCCKVHRV